MEHILVTDKVHELLIEALINAGHKVTYDTSINISSLGKIISQYTGIIINSKIVMDQALIDQGSKLKFISRLGSGMEIIDVSYAKSKGIAVISTPEGNRNAVAEHAMGMLLAFSNNIIKADHEVRKMEWNREENRGFELKGKTIGIIGLGHTGGEFAKKLSSWGVNVIAYDKYKTVFDAELDFVGKMNLNDIFTKSDIISLHLPLTEESKYMINDKSIALCKNGIIFVNTSRGNVIHLPSLIDGLSSGKVAGACLDVFENEKPESFSEVERAMYNKLYEMSNVVLSPHIAGWTRESLEKIAKLTLERIENVLKK